jgi:hypothetical protein
MEQKNDGIENSIVDFIEDVGHLHFCCSGIAVLCFLSAGKP